MYIDGEVWKLIEFCNNYEALNEKFFLELSSDYKSGVNKLNSENKNANRESVSINRDENVTNLDI
jgi:hypothetical protein